MVGGDADVVAICGRAHHEPELPPPPPPPTLPPENDRPTRARTRARRCGVTARDRRTHRVDQHRMGQRGRLGGRHVALVERLAPRTRGAERHRPRAVLAEQAVLPRPVDVLAFARLEEPAERLGPQRQCRSGRAADAQQLAVQEVGEDRRHDDPERDGAADAVEQPEQGDDERSGAEEDQERGSRPASRPPSRSRVARWHRVAGVATSPTTRSTWRAPCGRRTTRSRTSCRRCRARCGHGRRGSCRCGPLRRGRARPVSGPIRAPGRGPPCRA